MAPTVTKAQEETRVRTRSRSEAVPEVSESIQELRDSLAAIRKQKKNDRDESRDDVESEQAPTSPCLEGDGGEAALAAVQVWDDFLNESNETLKNTQFTAKIYQILPEDKADQLGEVIGSEIDLKKDSFINTSETNVEKLKKKMRRLVTVIMIRESEGALRSERA